MSTRTEAVTALARRLGAGGPGPAPARIALAQRGRLRDGLDSPWRDFTARQIIWTVQCAFDWRARTGPAGAVSVLDAYDPARGGRLEVKAVGLISIARAGGSALVDRGELMRYLAELAWAPDALLANDSLRWRSVDRRTLAVSAGEGPRAAEVEMSLDVEGRVAGAYAPDRPRAVAGGFRPTPWRGRFADYRRHAGRLIPFAGEVGWVLDGREVVCWQAELTDWRLLDS